MSIRCSGQLHNHRNSNNYNNYNMQLQLTVFQQH